MPLIGMAGSTVMLMPALEALKLAVDLQFEAFEIFGEFPQCVFDELTGEARREAAELVEHSGIAVAVHAPFSSLNYSALNPGIRAESVRQTLQAVDLCAELGGRVVIVHTGEHVLSARVREQAPYADKLAWENNVTCLRTIAAFAQARGVTLCLENIGFEPEHMDRSVADLLRIREEVNQGGVEIFFTLDIGHARLNGELDLAIAEMGPHVRHLHFTDNFGQRDDHVIIGEGNFDYAPHLDFFRFFEGIITLEVVGIGADPTPALKSREFMRSLLKK
jgi:sugar phosphate isomerase/epimerase